MDAVRHPHQLENVADFYESSVVIDTFNAGFAGRWHTRIVPDGDGPKNSEEIVASLLGLRADHELLDFGCGVGLVAASLAKKTGCSVRGLNISGKQLAQARAIASELGLAETVVFDLYEGLRLPYPGECFDRISFFESVCHVPNKPALFDDFFRVLRPGGILAGQDWLVTRVDLAEQEYRDFIHAIEAACEVALHTLDQYRQILERAGFVNVTTIDARDIYAGMAASFTRPDHRPTHVAPTDDMKTRLAKANLALSNAYHRGLFTVGFVRAEKPARTRPRGRIRPDGTDYETGTVDCLSAKKNVDVIKRHVELFGVAESSELVSFMGLVADAPLSSAEVSCKVDENERFPARFNLYFHGDPRDAYQRVRFYFETLGLSCDVLDDFVDPDFEFGRLEKVVTGLDLRAVPAESRAKIWFMLRDYPQKVEQALDMADDGRARSLLLHLPFLVGFDVHFDSPVCGRRPSGGLPDGTTRVKLYPDIRPEELADQRVQNALSAEAIRAMAECRWTHVYFPGAGVQPVLQHHPREPDGFVERYLAADLAGPIHAHYAGAPMLDMVVSLRHDLIGKAKARNFVLYYMPRGDVPAGTGAR